MQISRHWRLNAQRYRLEGTRLQNGEVSLQERIMPEPAQEQDNTPANHIEEVQRLRVAEHKMAS